ncbi:hypothetical protein CK203_058885 [Vitis vinifera]|uniref:Uncharacterized protein n=1 Tax=Vitis vinifera TaxID=29760 RepID=A0A438FS50_VITVI|nr:hypothetical protein CK203_058885 [Vitis vinifera]
MGSCVSVHKSSESTMKLQWSTASKTTDSVLNESPVKENTVNTQQFKPQLTPSFRELGMIFSSGLHIYILGSVLALIIRTSPMVMASGSRRHQFRKPYYFCFACYDSLIMQFTAVVTRFPHKNGFSSSKEEVFFDSQPWLESDCEDFSASMVAVFHADSTPHHGNTPMNQSSFRETPRLDRSHHMDKSPNSLIEPSPSDKKKLIELFRESFGDDPFVGNQDLQGIESNMANGRLKAKATILTF